MVDPKSNWEALLQERFKFEKQILLRAFQDKQFRDNLKADPKKVLATDYGQQLPGGVEFEVISESERNTLEIVLPTLPQQMETTEELSDEALEQVAGGASWIGKTSDAYIFESGPKNPDEGPFLVYRSPPQPAPHVPLPPWPADPCPEPAEPDPEPDEGEGFRRR